MAQNEAPVIKEGVVLNTSLNREWKGPKGVVYYFNIEFDNGDKGQFSTNKNPQTKFIEGEKHQYTVVTETKQGPNGPWQSTKIDRYKPPQDRQYAQSYNDPKRRERIMRTVAAYACLPYIYKTEINKDKEPEDKVDPRDVCDAFVEWMEGVTKNFPDTEQEGANIATQSGIKICAAILDFLDKEDAEKYSDMDKYLKLAAFWFNYIYFGRDKK